MVYICPCCYTLCNPVSELRLYFPFIPFSFLRTLFHFYHFSIPSSNVYPFNPFPNSVLPNLDRLSLTSPFLPVFPIHPDCKPHNPVLELLIPPCCAHFPALFSVVIKASYRCKAESVRILTKYNPLAHYPL